MPMMHHKAANLGRTVRRLGGTGLRVLLTLGALLGAVSGADPAVALGPQARDAAQRALSAAESGRWAAAEALARSIGSPELTDYLLWLRLRDERATAAIAEYASFLAEHADWPGLGPLRARAEAVLADKADDRTVLAFFASAEPTTGKGRVRLAKALLAAGHERRAIELLRRSWVEDDLSESDERAVLAAHGDRLQAADHRARLDRLLWDGREAAARRMLPHVDREHRALAEARLRLRGDRSPDAAVAAVPPALLGTAGLAYERVRWRRVKGLDSGAQAILLDPPSSLGRPKLWWDERSIQVRRALRTSQYRLAYRLAAGHGLESGAELAEAEWTAGWLALRFTREPERAAAHFQRMADIVRTPISRARASYWSGRAASALGRTEAAQRHYRDAAAFPHTFYGQLAATELGLVIQPKLTQVAAASVADPGDHALGRTARLLCELGAHERAVPFVVQLARNAGDDAAARGALRLARDCGRADLAVRAAKALPPEREVTLEASHPIPRIAALTGRRPSLPEPALRLAVTRQESQFDPMARSPAGARGLMQLMPPTARSMARDLGLPFAIERLTRDPDYNARLGVRYLERQLVRFDGEVVLALAAYNAGPGRVAEWLATYGDPRGGDAHRWIDWIELIPFTETRNYVQRVLESREVYARRLEAPSATQLVAVRPDQLQQADRSPADDEPT